MSKSTATDYIPLQEQLVHTASFRETERACLALVETELDVAFSYLHSAEANGRGGGKSEDATELIAKALAAHNSVLQYLANVPAEFDQDKRRLCIKARRLFDAIRAAEQRLGHSGAPVLREARAGLDLVKPAVVT